MSVKVLVCGGRLYSNKDALYTILDHIHTKKIIDLIIHGGARGADSLAGEWAIDNGISVAVYKADWNKHGKGAGPIRNETMLNESDPDLVVAFPGGNGTSHMIKISKKFTKVRAKA
jgi:hypothetical protein